MEFPSPQYWSGQPFPSPGDLPNPGIEPRSPTLQADSSPAGPPGKHAFVIHAVSIYASFVTTESALSLIALISPSGKLDDAAA